MATVVVCCLWRGEFARSDLGSQCQLDSPVGTCISILHFHAGMGDSTAPIAPPSIHMRKGTTGRRGQGLAARAGKKSINRILDTEVNESTNERKKTLRSKGSSKLPTLVTWSYTIEYTIGQSYHGRANRYMYDTRSLVSIFYCGWERYLVLRKP